MPVIGLDNLYFAELETGTDNAGATSEPTYKTPFKIAKAIEINMTPIMADGELYTDDMLDEYESAVVGYDLSMNVNDLLANSETKLLGKKMDGNGAVITGTSDEAPFGALMCRQKLSKGVGGGYRYRVLYKTRFGSFAEGSQTKGSSINYQTPTLTGKALPREFDGEIMTKLDDHGDKKSVTENWFTSVYEPKEVPEG